MDAVTMAYAVNANFVYYAAASIHSMKMASDSNRTYHVFVLHSSLSNEDIRHLENLSNKNVKVKCICVSEYIAGIKLRTLNRFSEEIWFRFFLPEVFQHLDKALYIDADTVVLEDIGRLYDTDLEGCIMGAVEDINSQRGERLGCKKYYNSGVMLMDLNQMRKENLKEKCIDSALTRPEMTLPDQDALNVVCEGRICPLEARWNFLCHSGLVNNAYKERLGGKSIGIVHYAPTKPEYLPMCELTKPFWDSIEELNLFHELMERKNNVPEEKRMVDLWAVNMVRDDFERGKLGLRNILGFTKCWMRHKRGE